MASIPPAPDGTTAQAAPSAERLPHVGEITPSAAADDRAADTEATPVHEAAGVAEIAPSPVTNDNAAESSAPPVRAGAQIREIAPSLVISRSVAGGNASPVREATEKEVLKSLLVASRKEEPLRPNFLSFYGLSEQPFDVTPDPEYLYLGQTHREALTLLLEGVQNVRGFMALIAEPGMGKTTLLNKLMEEVRGTARTVFLFQTQCNSRELLRYLLSELDVKNTGMDVVAMHRALNEILFQEMLHGRRFVLIVDEAQNLPASVLETVRLLSDFETTHTKLLQIVLAGQPPLVDTLMRPDLSQLRQRIAILTNLEPLSASEIPHYVEHRLRTAGSSGEPIFAPDALAIVAERSQGIPRSINNLCFNALLLGCSEGCKTIDSEIVRKVVAKLDLGSLLRRPPQGAAGSQPASGSFNQAQAKTSVTLTGKVGEKLRSRSGPTRPNARFEFCSKGNLGWTFLLPTVITAAAFTSVRNKPQLFDQVNQSG